MEKYKFQAKSEKDLLEKALEELNVKEEEIVTRTYEEKGGLFSEKKYTLDKFAQDDLELKLKILEIAAVGGYRDCTWAINAFNKDHAAQWKKDHPAKPVAKSRKVNLGEEVF